MIIPWELKEEYMAIIRRVMTLNPSLRISELKRRLEQADKPLNLSREYLEKLVAEIREERVREISRETKEEIYGQIADLVEFINNQLRAIAQEEKLVYTERDSKTGEPAAAPKMRIFAQNNRIKALNSIVDNTMKLIQLKMDLGIIERKVGTMDHKIIDVMSALKKIRNGDYTTPIEQLIPTTEVTGEALGTGEQN